MLHLIHSIGLLLLFALSGAIANQPTHLYSRNSTGLSDVVTWDSHSLSIYGQRVFILSAEVHPWRLPNPELWQDIFQKVKAGGFNTVSCYFNWAVHYPTPTTNQGQGDFQEGTYRDLQRFLDEAKKAGLWVIARPGPYINAETTGGGFPGWVGNIAGSLRTNNTNYAQAWTPYMTAISKLIAKNQIINGGPIILVQAENEYSESAGNNIYMQAILDLYRANGIVIPTTHNDQHGGATGNFSPDRPGLGRVNIYCGDSYPEGGKATPAQVQSVYYSGHVANAPNNPLCLAEFGGGFLISWGAGTRGGTGYEGYANSFTAVDYENVFYKENYAQTATILNIYMLFGGTNWGQTGEPTVYSSYDYGGGINENRVSTIKMNEMRLQGLFLQVSRDLLATNLIANGTNYTTSALVHTAELVNPLTGAGFYVIRHDASPSLALTTTQLTVKTLLGSLVIPKTGVLTLNGRESKIIVTEYVFGQSNVRMLYSTAEVMTWTSIDSVDYLILYAPTGQTGETAFIFANNATVNVANAPHVTSESLANSTFTLNYALNGTQIVDITAGTSHLRVIILDKPSANQWHAPIIAGLGNYGNYFSFGSNQTVLVSGPYLVRTADISGNTLALTGDLNTTTSLEFIASSSVTALTWNGGQVPITQSKRWSWTATLQAAPSATLPSLVNRPWKVIGSLPEASLEFDDSAFTTATLTTTNYTNLPPLAGNIVLYSQQYGFYGGNLIFRGHFTASGNETGFNLTVQGGFAFAYSVYLNGKFLGSSQGTPAISVTTTSWTVPAQTLLVGGDNVLVVLQDHMGIVETSTNSGKEPRGIRGYQIIGGNTTFTQWKLQGNQGGAANTPDTFRGYLNEGGLYAERIGAHLPGFDDSLWQDSSPFASGGVGGGGVNFYRTTFSLSLPPKTDVPIRLSITPSDITKNFRVQIYLNGWQLGKYINNLGPQTLYVLPAGILRTASPNTLALSLWSLDGTRAILEGLELVSDGSFATALDIQDYTRAPEYDEQQKANRPEPKYIAPM